MITSSRFHAILFGSYIGILSYGNSYIRCSIEEQNEAKKEEMAGSIKADITFKDKASGKNTDRPAFKEKES